jgi:hypothetical protein
MAVGESRFILGAPTNTLRASPKTRCSTSSKPSALLLTLVRESVDGAPLAVWIRTPHLDAAVRFNGLSAVVPTMAPRMPWSGNIKEVHPWRNKPMRKDGTVRHGAVRENADNARPAESSILVAATGRAKKIGL